MACKPAAGGRWRGHAAEMDGNAKRTPVTSLLAQGRVACIYATPALWVLPSPKGFGSRRVPCFLETFSAGCLGTRRARSRGGRCYLLLRPADPERVAGADPEPFGLEVGPHAVAGPCPARKAGHRARPCSGSTGRQSCAVALSLGPKGPLNPFCPARDPNLFGPARVPRLDLHWRSRSLQKGSAVALGLRGLRPAVEQVYAGAMPKAPNFWSIVRGAPRAGDCSRA